TIAGRVGLPAAVVEAYEAAFFAVRGMRQATDWLLIQAVGYCPFGGFTEPLPWAGWRLAGFTGGPLLVDLVIAATAGRPLPDGFVTEAGPRGAYAAARSRLLARLWMWSMAAVTDEEFAHVVKVRQRLRDLDARVTG